MLNWVEVDLGALAHNLNIVKSHLDPEVKIMAVIKANAYGHGLLESARVFWGAGAEWLGVGTIEEAIELRVSKIKVPILVMGYVEPPDYRRAIDFDISLTMYNPFELKQLSAAAQKLKRAAKVHLKVDTGMFRLGVDYREASKIVALIKGLQLVKLEAIYSHFSSADDLVYSREQLRNLQVFLFELQRQSHETLPVHMSSSRAIANFPEAHFEIVRPGISLYGLGEAFPNLRPALSFKTIISQLKRVPAGVTIGYDRTFTTKRPSEVAILPVGYSHGYPRALSNKVEVLVSGARAKVVGRVCMNQTIIDVTGINLRENYEVTLIGAEGDDRITAEDLAKICETNPHEIVSRIPKDIPRIYKRVALEETNDRKDEEFEQA